MYALRPILTPAYRAYIGTSPTFAFGGPDDGRPDVGVRDWPPDEPATPSEPDPTSAPNQEIAVATLAAEKSLLVERAGRLVAAVELASPRNKDRPASRMGCSATYAAYLLRGFHLLLIDVHRRPAVFSFADQLAAELSMTQPLMPARCAVGYRVGGPSPDGGAVLGALAASPHSRRAVAFDGPAAVAR